MPSKLSFVSLSIGALVTLSVITTTINAYALSGDTDLITIDTDRSSCNPSAPGYFFLYYSYTGMPVPNSGWVIVELESSNEITTRIEESWNPERVQTGSGSGGI